MSDSDYYAKQLKVIDKLLKQWDTKMAELKEEVVKAEEIEDFTSEFDPPVIKTSTKGTTPDFYWDDPWEDEDEKWDYVCDPLNCADDEEYRAVNDYYSKVIRRRVNRLEDFLLEGYTITDVTVDRDEDDYIIICEVYDSHRSYIIRTVEDGECSINPFKDRMLKLPYGMNRSGKTYYLSRVDEE